MKDILLVEDNRELAELLQAFLEKGGFTVHPVPTGEEAAAYLEENNVKIMLLDIMLPGMDGFAVCRTVREKGDIPILIMSARAEKDDKLNGFGLGADDYGKACGPGPADCQGAGTAAENLRGQK